jgi:hypothetical protein
VHRSHCWIPRQLRERGLVTFQSGRVEFHDRESLRDLAEYHSGYLDQSNGRGLKVAPIR